MAVTVTKTRNLNMGTFNAMEFNFSGDGSAKYADTGLNLKLKGAILLGTIADEVTHELNTQDSSATSNGSIYWPTALGDGETADMIVWY